MTEQPIDLYAHEVRALLAGRLTKLYRPIAICDDPITEADCSAGARQRGIPSNAQNVRWVGLVKCDAPLGSHTVSARVECPYGELDDRLWGREDHAQFAVGNRTGVSPQCVAYRATCAEDGSFEYDNLDETLTLKVTKWTPAVEMPRWAARIVLELVAVRAHRLHYLTEEEAVAAGVATGLIPADDYGPVRYGFVHGVDDGRCVLYPEPIDAVAARWNEVHGAGAWDRNPWCWALTVRRVEAK